MASYVETTAVSLRKGNKTANENFVGILGELVADLGVETSTGSLGMDVNTTLRLHNGVTKGGIPMARADTLNLTTKVLAENRQYLGNGEKNLAYADLANLETTTNTIAKENIVNVLSSYGLASDKELADEVALLAKKDMSNVFTRDLAESGRVPDSFGKNGDLAYANTSNINTKELAGFTYRDGTDGNNPLAYYNFSNADTSLLALDEHDTNRPDGMVGPGFVTTTLDNIPSVTWLQLFDSHLLEYTSNKDTYIDEDNIIGNNYPTTAAVVSYITTTLPTLGYLQSDFSNATTYLPLTLDKQTYYSFVLPAEDDTVIQSAGTGFLNEEGREYFLGLMVTNEAGEEEELRLTDLQLNGEGAITDFAFYPSEGENAISETVEVLSPTGGNKAIITIKSNSILPAIGGAGLLKNSLSNLPGMSQFDKDESVGVQWRINIQEPIPSTSTSFIEEKQNSTLATNGAVWSFVKNSIGGAIYEKIKVISNTSTIILEEGYKIYQYRPVVVQPITELIFNTSELNTQDDEVITFELLLTGLGTNIVSFQQNVAWLNNDYPQLGIEGQNPQLVFRSYDKGKTWIGNSQGNYPDYIPQL